MVYNHSFLDTTVEYCVDLKDDDRVGSEGANKTQAKIPGFLRRLRRDNNDNDSITSHDSLKLDQSLRCQRSERSDSRSPLAVVQKDSKDVIMIAPKHPPAWVSFAVSGGDMSDEKVSDTPKIRSTMMHSTSDKSSAEKDAVQI